MDERLEQMLLEQARAEYEEVEIPEELHDRVLAGIAEGKSRRAKTASTKSVVKKKPHYWRRGLETAAALTVCFTLGLNTSEVFAKTMEEIPVLGSIARVLTVRSYEISEDNINISVQVPGIEADGMVGAALPEGGQSDAGLPADDTLQKLEQQEYVGNLNDAIAQFTDEYVAGAKQELEDYKKAFLETGGTEEEWAEREMDIKVDYRLTYQKGSVVSFVIEAYESAFAFSAENRYYNIDLQNMRELTLEDVLGEDYVSVANEQILAQMKQRMAEEELVYWGLDDKEEYDMEGFTTVDENTTFYLNEEGKAVITFPKYSIGPGSIGVQEFVIEPVQ